MSNGPKGGIIVLFTDGKPVIGGGFRFIGFVIYLELMLNLLFGSNIH